MATSLQGKRIAILATDGFEQAELLEPQKALQQAGAETQVIAPKGPKIKGWDHDHWGQEVPVDVTLDSANAADYDALLLPGGVMNPDKLRTEEKALRFIREIVNASKPVAAICHGPWTLVEIGFVEGRTLTSWPSLKTDIRNAGGTWVDEVVVADQGLVTSRKPADIPAFNQKMIEVFAESRKTSRGGAV